MFGRRSYQDGYEDGVEECLRVMRERGLRAGGIIDPHNAEVEVRALLLNEHPDPIHDEPRSR